MPAWNNLLDQLRMSAFADVAGARATLQLPVSDRLITQLIRERITPDWPIREFDLRALDGNEFIIQLRLRRPAVLPAFRIRVVIVEQPQLPHSPVLTLRLASKELGTLATTALKFFKMPAGLEFADERLRVDLRVLGHRYGFETALDYLTKLEIWSEAGRLLIDSEAIVPPVVSRTPAN